MSNTAIKPLSIVPAPAYDAEITIATGANRKTKKWKNETMLWSALVRKLKQETRTPETMSEYARMKAQDRDEAKDVGGFVGGLLKDGRRKSENVINRCLITLDIDYADTGIWERYKMIYDNACFMYPTHSSTMDKPRYRLIMPLDRPVKADEYEAIGRKIADTLGMDLFDDSTYQASRLMYWPSVPSDAEYRYYYMDGPFVKADDVLGEYPEGRWFDVSLWPVSTRATEKVQSDLKKQQDPTTKEGLIGAFCRAYTIQDALDKFLGSVYEKCDTGDGNRYSYIEGSTSGGVVCYDDKFCYSNHATDPASNMLCNAFDIVRIHRFYVVHEYEGEDKAKKVSMAEMKRLAAEDKLVKRQILEDKRGELESDFGGEVVGDVESLDTELSSHAESKEDAHKWQDGLELDDKGRLIMCAGNVRLILNNDPVFRGSFKYNMFSGRLEVQRSLKWRKNDDLSDFSDNDLGGIVSEFDILYGMRGGKQIITHELGVYQLMNQYHPVKDYLGSLPEWDGVERLERLFIDYLGAEDNKYVRAVTRAELIAAVKRVYEPGAKFDEAIILVGPQGIGKSTILSKMAKGEWFTDGLTTFKDKEAMEQLQGNWIVEIGELSAMKRSESEDVKRFLSTTVDACRPAYGRYKEYRPRQCVFIGTTNNEEFLRDATGERRFWPVECSGEGCKNVWDDLTDEVVDQIWAEAKKAYEDGESVFITDKEVREAMKRAQIEHKEGGEMLGVIDAYLEMLVPKNWNTLPLSDKRAYIEEYRNSTDGEDDTVGIFDVGGEAEGAEKELVQIDRICPKSVFMEVLGYSENSNISYDVKREVKSALSIIGARDEWEGPKRLKFGKSIGQQRGYFRGENSPD